MIRFSENVRRLERGIVLEKIGDTTLEKMMFHEDCHKESR